MDTPARFKQEPDVDFVTHAQTVFHSPPMALRSCASSGQSSQIVEILAYHDLKNCNPDYGSWYRILVNNEIRYVEVRGGTYDIPFPQLPQLDLDKDWKVTRVWRDDQSGELATELSAEPLQGINLKWHQNMIDFTDIQVDRSLAAFTFEVHAAAPMASLPPPPTKMIAKMDLYQFKIDDFEKETGVYRMLEGTGLAPRFLGHIHDRGRIIGFLLEKVDNYPPSRPYAGFKELRDVFIALHRFHKLGLLHNDLGSGNMIFTKEGPVKLIDFEFSKFGASRREKESETMELRQLFGIEER